MRRKCNDPLHFCQGGHVVTLVERLDTQADRDWYASRSVAQGWSRNVLEHHIRTRLHERSAIASTNFDRALEPDQSDLARQFTKDPYVLDFLAVDGDARERELEQALVDLLFFHVEQLRYVVIELKTGRFRPEQLGQLGFYVALVDDRLRRAHHADTVGLLLVAGKTDAVVRYSLAGQRAPVAVSSYDLLPEAERAALPSEAVLARAVRDPREP